MNQTIVQEIKNLLLQALEKQGIVEDNIPLETNKNIGNGQFSSTAALAFAKKLQMKPLELAQKLKAELETSSLIQNVEIASPGFINIELTPKAIGSIVETVVLAKNAYGQGKKKDQLISLEEVSVNPTGFLHLAHARNATIGDSLFRILTFAGYDVETEYYVNDAGNQINQLALTVFVNYLNLLGKKTELPENAYRGEGYDVVAQQIIDQKGSEFLATPFDEHMILDSAVNQYFREVSTEYFLNVIKAQLAQMDVRIENYISEKTLYPQIPELLKTYEQLGATYQEDDALFLNTTKFGDDKDRVLVKTDGTYTYLTSDLVNHATRLKRTQAQKLINVWGGDHHGYIARLKAGLEWLGANSDLLEIEMIQIVRVIKDGQEFKMSKRKGTAVWLVDILDIVGKDALRYMLASKAATSHMDLDLDLIKQKNASNPVYYCQYATARLNSVLNQGKEQGMKPNTQVGDLLKEAKELELLICLDSFPDVVQAASKKRAPNIITDYIQKVSAYFHSYYAEFKIVDSSQKELSEARLGLVQATLQVLSNAFALIGLNVVEVM